MCKISVKLGSFTPPGSPAKIKEEIVNFHTLWKQGKLKQGMHPEILKFERRELTRQLVCHLDRISGFESEMRPYELS
jgi:hypothetical protein